MSVEQDAERLAAKFRAMQEGTTLILQRRIMRHTLIIVAAAKGRVAVDRGGLRNSITFEIDDDGLGSTMGTNSEYGLSTEFGRLPGSMPPVDPLIAWAKRKGFEDPEAMGWAIAIHMRDHGTDPRPFLFPSFEEEKPKFEQGVRDDVVQLVRSMSGPGKPPAAAGGAA